MKPLPTLRPSGWRLRTAAAGQRRSTWLPVATLLLAVGAVADPVRAEATLGGQVRPGLMLVQRADAGPLALADALQPGVLALPRSSLSLDSEWRASGSGLTATATLHQFRDQGRGWRTQGWFNELNASGGGDAWQFSAGRKIVGWDVGYGWRPNDVVQQEARRQLMSSTAEGRPLLMAEHFDASTAWSAVWVNPGRSAQRRGGEEPALALRVYQRDAALDWHGFARWGRRTHGSLGGAVAWVAGDALELHASARWVAAADTLAWTAADDDGAPTLQRSNPWQPALTHEAAQLLVGGTWTDENQLSLLAEAWWDGTAASAARWRAWSQRNEALGTLRTTPAPLSAIAGNLAWQTSALQAGANLQRGNVLLRATWTHEAWQPALDLLWHPADGGRVWTASLGWQGDRLRVDGGCRSTGGPAGSVLAQLPTRRSAYLAGTWAF